MHPLAKLDHKFVWHPFTQMRDWLQARADCHRVGQRRGAARRKRPRISGRQFFHLDESARPQSSQNQRGDFAAVEKNRAQFRAGICQRTGQLACGKISCGGQFRIQNSKSKTGKSFLFRRRLDCARSCAQTGLRIYARTRGKLAGRASSRAAQPKFLSLEGAYHGDTVGAVSLGHIDLFHQGLRRTVVQKRQGHVAILLSLPVQSRQTGTRRRAELSQMQLGMRRQGGTKIFRAKEKRKSVRRVCF